MEAVAVTPVVSVARPDTHIVGTVGWSLLDVVFLDVVVLDVEVSEGVVHDSIFFSELVVHDCIFVSEVVSIVIWSVVNVVRVCGLACAAVGGGEVSGVPCVRSAPRWVQAVQVATITVSVLWLSFIRAD